MTTECEALAAGIAKDAVSDDDDFSAPPASVESETEPDDGSDVGSTSDRVNLPMTTRKPL